ncbi:MAG: methyltransferase domain-containing protein [Boseongicola sp. SB0664_bin_43]|uniref:Methyltransferase domain-containing protein n=1 Tax=Boseongicola sp. SB0664_bin_43 TaxID=2604844 RepID=A0A6B0Y5Q0_9RHOB|nr:methyltransferase domain-containing protein [Boseongicola sp. SB0664_bin_43]MYK33450.1 methyltransferase domain-containing protein [Boseongicola sp. SB0670_bin_30]
MPKGKVDTKAVGLDAGVSFIRWLTGAENLHYGLWTDLEPVAVNVGKAQEAYTERLLGFLPEGPLSILDIGGGAGETARKLVDLGHGVDIVVPSRPLAERCRANAPDARVHETTFEAFDSDTSFDLCLFSESFQYIPLRVALDKALHLAAPGGHVLIADCFRSEQFTPGGETRAVGGGHPVAEFRAALETCAGEVLRQEDITEAVAPSIDIEQGLLRVLGDAVARVDAELLTKRPVMRWLLARAAKLAFGRRRLHRLDRRLRGDERSSTAFVRNNRYLVTLIQKERERAVRPEPNAAAV